MRKSPCSLPLPTKRSGVCARIEDAMSMVSHLNAVRGVSANDTAFLMGRRGIVQGTAIEIMKVLGGVPGFVNIARPPWLRGT